MVTRNQPLRRMPLFGFCWLLFVLSMIACTAPSRAHGVSRGGRDPKRDTHVEDHIIESGDLELDTSASIELQSSYPSRSQIIARFGFGARRGNARRIGRLYDADVEALGDSGAANTHDQHDQRLEDKGTMSEMPREGPETISEPLGHSANNRITGDDGSVNPSQCTACQRWRRRSAAALAAASGLSGGSSTGSSSDSSSGTSSDSTTPAWARTAYSYRCPICVVIACAFMLVVLHLVTVVVILGCWRRRQARAVRDRAVMEYLEAQENDRDRRVREVMRQRREGRQRRYRI